MICWFCQGDIAVNASTCWPVETPGGTQNAATHSRCMSRIMNTIHGHPPQNIRGPGGNNITGYTRGKAPQYG